MRLRFLLIPAVSLIFSGVMSAGPVTWTLTNVGLSDNTKTTGSFVFDADTTTFSSLQLTTTGGDFTASTNSWSFATNMPDGLRNASGATGFTAVDATGGDYTGAHYIALFSFAGPIMTNAGGTINLTFLSSGICGNGDC